MSPEQARSSKHLDQRADIWSMGVVLYEALTGTTPHHDKTTLGDLIVAICVEPTPPVQRRAPWVSPELAAIIAKALERDPAARFQSAAEMHAALVRLLPNGTNIRSDMLVSLTPEMRAHVAPSIPGASATGPGAPQASPAFVQSASTPGIQLAAGTTNPELGATSSKSGSLRWVALGGAVLAIVGLGLGGVAVAKKSTHRQVVATTTAIVATTEPPPPAPPVSAAPVTKTVHVAIAAPSGASEELDGAAATLTNGVLDITGTPGSQHKVRVTHEGASSEHYVAILESGAAMPGRIELAAKPAAKAAAGAAAAPKTAAAPASAAPPPPATATGPVIKKEF
jgi:serine/threonine-protein kinase